MQGPNRSTEIDLHAAFIRNEETSRHHPAPLEQTAEQLRELCLDRLKPSAADHRQQGLRQLPVASARDAIVLAKTERRFLEICKDEVVAPTARIANSRRPKCHGNAEMPDAEKKRQHACRGADAGKSP